MDKSTKLETISDRIETIRTRIEIIKRDHVIECQRRLRTGEGTPDEIENYLVDELEKLEEIQQFIENANIGGEYLNDTTIKRIESLSRIKFKLQGAEHPLLTEEEISNLSVRRGTLTPDERLIINGHMVETIKMLEALPFPPNLHRVPEYAGGHHEKMDGQGYPKGVYGGDMSVPARIMAIADVFEALTALDRPYKKGKTLSNTMSIMGKMKAENHLDPELFDLFITSGVYREYAEKFMPPELIDHVDEQDLLSIQPVAFVLPPAEERKQRKIGFLPQYENLPKSM